MSINNFDAKSFLAKHWQQKPLLIRQAFPAFANADNHPISAEELAGLACEEEIESRLVIEKDGQWMLEHGPLAEERFASLPKSHWTLLVQAVDHWWPEVSELLDQFRFIPAWRIDDVMVSYATTGGSVGPHYDNYDVFLVQGTGKRRWQIGPKYDSLSARQDNNQLLLLQNFQCTEEFVLEPGDMLYLPPQLGHWGTALDDNCMTYSVGFRAPSHAELLSDFCDEQISFMQEEQRFNDPNLKLQNNHFEIDTAAIEQVQAILSARLNDKQAIAQWFGRYMTEPKYLQAPDDSHTSFDEHALQALIDSNTELYRDPTVRAACHQQDGHFSLFINGNSTLLDRPEAIALAGLMLSCHEINSAELAPCRTEAERQLLLFLLNTGFLFPE